MIKLATVFSGIGAIEHALDRMNVDHKIVFACDNGDVDILNKDVGMNIDALGDEVQAIQSTIADLQIDASVEDLYMQQLFGMYKESLREYDYIFKVLSSLPHSVISIEDVLSQIIEMSKIKASRKKEYIIFRDELKIGSEQQKKFKGLQIILEVVNDFKKDNNLEDLGEKKDFSSIDGIDWNPISHSVRSL
ncbi:MAG: DNA (cytosine-5-)-methyltransferase, partial [Clostridia bacterium]|nr:DNA (cytosine-5-)-methyltransferase [Clostridia bacterium]